MALRKKQKLEVGFRSRFFLHTSFWRIKRKYDHIETLTYRLIEFFIIKIKELTFKANDSIKNAIQPTYLPFKLFDLKCSYF